jgi:hypothetical protein
MLTYGLVAMLYLFFGSTPSEIQATLTVIVTYDPDGNGQREGVGEGRLIQVSQNGSFIEIGSTDKNSSHTFFLDPGVYKIEAFVSASHFFYRWECIDYLYLESNGDIIELKCRERFFISIPFITDWS